MRHKDERTHQSANARRCLPRHHRRPSMGQQSAFELLVHHTHPEHVLGSTTKRRREKVAQR